MTTEKAAETLGTIIGYGLIIGAVAFGINACSDKEDVKTATPKATSTAVVSTAPVIEEVKPVVVAEVPKVVPTVVPTKVVAAVEPGVCSGYRDDIESNLKRSAMIDAEGISDNSAPRATMREQKKIGYKTDIQTTLNLMAAQKCELPKSTPNAAKYLTSALDCSLKNMKATNESEMCDMWKEIKAN
jgi:hypothetical protein